MLTPGSCLTQLLGHPGVRGMGSDGRMHDPPRGQFDDDEDEKGSEEEEESLFSEGRRPGQEKEPESVLIADLRAFDVALQDDELLAEEGILGDKIAPATDHITSGAGDQRVGAGSEPALDAVAELVADGAE